MDASAKFNEKMQSANPKNPTDSQRHDMLYKSLVKAGRAEDYQNIINLLSPLPDIIRYASSGEFKNVKVGIIGGGLSGMAAAFELRKLGFDITVFEPTTTHMGGRIYTYYFNDNKTLYGELGAMRFPVSHETVWHYIDLFKLDTEPLLQSDPETFFYIRGIRVKNDSEGKNIFHKIYPQFELTVQETNTPWPALLGKVNSYYLSTMPPDIRKQFLMILPAYDHRYQSIENLSSRQALQQYGLSNEAVNLISSIMPNFGALIYHSYESSLCTDYTLDFSNLYQICGGMVKLPLAFYNSLTSPRPKEYPDIPQSDIGNVNWRGGQLVTGIYKSGNDGKIILSYKILQNNKNDFEKFDYVICAVPIPVLKSMAIQPSFAGKKSQVIREVYYENAQKTLFLCKERFWEKQGIRGGSSFTDGVIEVVSYPQDYNRSIIKGKGNVLHDKRGVLLASYNIGEDAYALGNISPSIQREIIKREIEKVHGLTEGYLDNIVIDSKTIDWVREPWFFGAFQMFLPGQKKDFLYSTFKPEYDNRVFFAGEHTSVKNAWMQGALQSGMAAANDVAYYSIIHKYQR